MLKESPWWRLACTSIHFGDEFTLYLIPNKVHSMKKALAILALAIIILSLWTFNNSFIVSSTDGSVSGESAVILAKADYVSVRAKILVIPQAGYRANVTFSDGTTKQLAWTYNFEVFFPRTGSSTFGSFGANAPGGIFLNGQKPFNCALISNITDSYFTTLNSGSSGSTTVYWFKVEGNARVIVAFYGVAI